MLDITYSELILICVIAMSVLGPKEVFDIIKSFRRLSVDFKKHYQNFLHYLSKELGEEQDNFVDIIIDKHGNQHKVYNLDIIKPFIKENNE